MCWDRDWVVKVTKRVGQLAQERRRGEGEQVSHKKRRFSGIIPAYIPVVTERRTQPFLTGAQTKPQQIPLKYFV